MPIISKERVENALKKFDETKSRYSRYIHENPTITYLRNYLKNFESLSATDTDTDTMLEYLLNHHKWGIYKRDDYISATDKCIISILVNIESENNVTNVRDTTSFVKIAGLLSGWQAQANRDAITVNGGKYVGSIARALSLLQSVSLLIAGRAEPNFNAITVNGGEYAWEIAQALYSLQNADLLIGEQARANRNAITVHGGEYAGGIAAALSLLQSAGLLIAEQAQANFNAITVHGGKYAGEICTILVSLNSSGLINSTNRTVNFEKLTQYIQYSTNNKHGIGFVATVIGDNTPITQELYNLLTSTSVDNTNKSENEDNDNECSIFLAALDNLDNEKEKVADSDMDGNNVSTQGNNTSKYALDIIEIIDLCEYIDTYFKEDERNSNNIFHTISWPLINSVLTQTDKIYLQILNTIFKGLSNIDDIVEAKGIINTIIAMIEKNRQPDSIFKVTTFNAIADVTDYPFSKAVNDDAPEINQFIIHLLCWCMRQPSFTSFKKAWDVLCAAEEKPQNLFENFGIFAVSKRSSRHNSFEAVAAQETKSPG